MKPNELVSEYFNKEYVKESHSIRLLTLLMEYWATERDYEIKSNLLKKLVMRYSVSERKLNELNSLKNRFIGLAAHDLRNPLTSIRGLSEILLEELAARLEDHHREYLNTIRTASDAMLTLVNDILDISAIESGRIELRKQPDSLGAILRERVRVNKPLADKKGIRLCHRLSDVSPFPLDRNRLSQVIDNLVGNAIKFTPPGKRIHIALRQHGHAAKVSVRDEGPGIPKEDMPKLFNEFQTLGAQPTGGEKCTGLGLAIARKIIEEHSGTIQVSSTVGQGSTFTFSIPMEANNGNHS